MSRDTGEQEIDALDALKSEMVLLFKDDPRSLFGNEAMLLSEVVNHKEFKDLIYGFTVAIRDDRPNAPDLLRYFAGFLRWRQREISRHDLNLETLLGDLSEHLNKINEVTEPRTSYLLTQAIGTLLDAMVDINVEGIDRSHEEPRMAQVAEYALQALDYIPNNESPWEEMLRWAGPDLLKLKKCLGQALKGGRELREAHDGLKQMIAAMRNRSERNKSADRDWYHGHRQVDILIQLRAYEILPDAITGLRCCVQPQFWCGLYSRLEKQWVSDEPSRGSIEGFIEWTFTQLSLQQVQWPLVLNKNFMLWRKDAVSWWAVFRLINTEWPRDTRADMDIHIVLTNCVSGRYCAIPAMSTTTGQSQWGTLSEGSLQETACVYLRE
ncbi:hypothetical protein N8T08_009180 [Aspergillus melleus]|uniref:Uncharacterized protein n=1 Tax=Aspergillus melleus TaxID=138277 RepID=A0ACC3ATU8_9EURO|nr:hypothetical protein N8T08_009180 [Aspergillus melleus]